MAFRLTELMPVVLPSCTASFGNGRSQGAIFLTLLILTINQYLPFCQTPAFTNLEMSFYNFNLTAEELNSLPKHLHPGHMFAIAKLLSVLRRVFDEQDPQLHRKGLLAATVSHQLHIMFPMLIHQGSRVAAPGHLA